jgi:tRNA threonylcarbamoyladenosine biosynthesis protein TsaB
VTLLLALEMACEPGGIALLEGERVLAEQVFAPVEQAGAVVVPRIQALLQEAGATLSGVEAIALTIGPGSFTGLRVGLSTALGLSFERAIPVVPVPTLAALSLHADGDCVVPMLDARKGQVYTGVYGPGAHSLVPDCASHPEPWLQSLQSRPGPLVLVGGGALQYREIARRVLGTRARVSEERTSGPSPATVGRLGERLLREGAALAPERVVLRYLRAPEAEVRAAAARP